MQMRSHFSRPWKEDENYKNIIFKEKLKRLIESSGI